MDVKDGQVALQDLIDGCRQTALRLRKKHPARIILLNAAVVMTSLGQELEKAWQEAADLRGKPAAALHQSGPVLILPGKGVHRVN
jgi:hypothetical protein